MLTRGDLRVQRCGAGRAPSCRILHQMDGHLHAPGNSSETHNKTFSDHCTLRPLTLLRRMFCWDSLARGDSSDLYHSCRSILHQNLAFSICSTWAASVAAAAAAAVAPSARIGIGGRRGGGAEAAARRGDSPGAWQQRGRLRNNRSRP